MFEVTVPKLPTRPQGGFTWLMGLKYILPLSIDARQLVITLDMLSPLMWVIILPFSFTLDCWSTKPDLFIS